MPNQAPEVTLLPPYNAPHGPETRVNTFTTGAQQLPAIAALANGGYVVVWRSIFQDDSPFGVYGQRYDPSGTPLGAEFRVSTTANHAFDIVTQAVAALPGGGFVVIWDSGLIYGQRYDAAGAAQGSEFVLNTALTNGVNSNAPSVASLPGGGYVAVWESGSQIFARIYDAAGAAQGAEFFVNSTLSAPHAHPSVAALAGGGFVVVWSGNGPGDTSGVFAQRFSNAGVAQGGETPVNSNVANGQGHASVAALTGGGFVVVWQSFGQDVASTSGIYAQRFDASGNKVGGELPVNTFTAGNQDVPCVAALADGGFIVGWASEQDTSGYGVYGQRYAANGVASGLETRISTHIPFDQDFPAVAGLPNGEFVFAWHSNHQDTSSNGIYLQRYGMEFLATEGIVADLKSYIGVFDPDAASGTISLTLSVNYGMITAAQGSSPAVVTGSGSNTVVFTGTLQDILGALSPFGFGVVFYSTNTDSPPATATLTATLSDNGHSGDGGALSDVATATIQITPINDAPAGLSNTFLVAVGSPYVLTTGHFAFTDPEGHGLHSVKIATLPDQGVLRLNGVSVAAGTFVSAADIAAGLLVFTPDPGEQGSPYTSFTFQIRDNGGLIGAGAQDTDQSPNFLAFNVVAGSVFLYNASAVLTGGFLSIQDALDAAATGYSIEVSEANTYSGALVFDVAGLTVRFATDAVQDIIWMPEGTLGIAITAGDGADNVTTGVGADTIRGGGGLDILRGDSGNDALHGDAGNDFLVGGTGNDILVGGLGDDTYYVDSTSDAISEFAGQGLDRLAATITLALAADADIERLDVEDLTSTNAIDLTGSAIANVIYGNDGVNILRGEAGNDELRGFGGNDFLVGGAGTDLMVGGTGDDTFYVDDASDAIGEIGGQGNDRIAASVSFVLSNGANVEVLEAVDLTATTAFDLTGSDSANAITGNNGVNILRGEGGNDILSSAGGNDFLVGGSGVDTMNGGLGNDTYYVDHISDVVAEFAGEGTADRVVVSTNYLLTANADIELIETATQSGTSAIGIVGSNIANTINGNDGANILDGRGGSDILTGNGGADTFQFTSVLGAANVDTIIDFVSSSDRIALDRLIFTALAPGAFSANAFKAASAATDADDRIVYNQATGALLYDADGNGAGAAMQFATLSGGPSLSASDFNVI